MKFLNIFLTSLICITLVTCGGGGGSSSSVAPNPPTPTPSTAVGVNIGNISTIPLGPSATSTFVVVTNNYPNGLVLSSATYTLYDSEGALAPQDARGANSPINVSQCTTVEASGSCSLVIAVPANTAPNGRFLVKLNFTNSATGTVYTTSQIISYSNVVPDNPTGVTFSNLNNTLYNRPGRITTYTVPFLLNETVDNLSALSEFSNPAFAPAISCPGSSPYPAGTLCTLYVKISDTGTNSLISGNIVVSTATSPTEISKDIRNKLNKTAAATGYLFNVPVTVVQNNIGNLVTSAINVIINPADGAHAQTITLLNNGAASITGISVTSNGVVTASNGCAGTLTVNSSCSFTVNANQTTNGQSSVTVNYTSGTTNSSFTFNAAYIALSTISGMTMTTNGTLINTVINNTPRTLNINVTNSSTAQLNNITFTPQSALPTGMTYTTGSGGSTCAIDGTESLSVGQSCTLQLQYAPTAISTGPSFIIRENAQYIAQDGSTGSYTASVVTVNYTAITSNAFVYLTPNPVTYAIRADGSESQSQTFTFINTSPNLSTTILSESLANPPVANYITTGGTCLPFPHVLGIVGSGTESCTVIGKYGPTTSNVSTSSQMTANYIANPTTNESAITLSILSFTASRAALIIVNNIVVSGQSSGNGNGAPYQFTNSPINTIGFTVTYQNTGTESALNFNVALNNLPVGYFIVESQSTCGRESSTSTLALGGGTCNVAYRAMSPTNSYNPYAFTGALNVNIPGFSYTDINTGVNTNTAPTFSPTYTSNTISVNANLFATPTESVANWTTATAGGSAPFTFFGSNGNVVTIPNTQLTIFSLSSSTCTMGVGGNCSITITNPAGYPVSTVNFLYILSPNAGSAPNGIIKKASFTYTN